MEANEGYPWHKPRFPKLLNGLVAEARKAGSFEEFEKDYSHQIKHGLYWHWTDDPNFIIDPQKGPRDMSSMAIGGISVGKLMIASHLSNWSNYGNDHKGRLYAAMIDMSDVPRNGYKQVSRGFGNEFFVNDPSMARVIKVYPRQVAFRVDKQHHQLIPKSKEALLDFYEFALTLPTQ